MTRRRTFGQIETIHSTVKNRPPRYRARYRGPDGVRYTSTTLASLSEAEAFLKTAERGILLGSWTPQDASERTPRAATMPTVSEWLERCIRERQKRPHRPITESTAANYRKYLRRELSGLADVRIDRLKRATVRAWLEVALANGRAAQTCQALKFLRGGLDEAVQAGLIHSNPARIPHVGQPAPKRVPQALSAAELRAYLAAAPQRYRLPLALAATCGLRSGEIRGLRLCDYNTQTGLLSIRKGVTRVPSEALNERGQRVGVIIHGNPKTPSSVRDVYVPGALRGALAEQVAAIVRQGQTPDGFLFPSTSALDSPIPEVTLRTSHYRARAAIGRDTLTLHDLRRTAATLAAQGGATLREVMALLGHTSPEVALRYQVAEARRLEAIADRMSAALGVGDF